MDRFINTRIMLRSQESATVFGGWLVAVRDNMLVISLCEEHQYETNESISVRAVSDCSEAIFEARIVGQKGRAIVLISPNVVRCSHSESGARYLVSDAAVQLSIDRKLHLAQCLDVSPTGIGLRVGAKIEVGRRYKLSFVAPGYDFQLTTECVYLRQIGTNEYRAGLEIFFAGRCDSGRWEKYIEAIAKQKRRDMTTTLKLMYLPSNRQKSQNKGIANLKIA